MEILNIHWHTVRLLLKALNKYPSKDKVAQALGITKKSVYNLMNQYDISYDTRKNNYYTKQMPEYIIIKV